METNCLKISRYCIALTLGILTHLFGFTQDFSNKGKEFWLAYSYHVGMVNAGGSPQMTLYITSDVATSYTVEIFGTAVIQTGTIAAGQVVNVNIPNSYFIDNEGLFTNRAIRITGEKPLVVYSYITRNAASAATLCLPTNVLGKEYYSLNYTQVSNEDNSNSFFTIVAVEDNTSVEITPTGNTKNGWVANHTYTVNLNKGEVYQVLGTTRGSNGEDLTGSKIKSIASGTGGCKRIAVFSGSGKIRIPATNCGANSSDNLYQQLYPTGTWGKKYLTVPSYNRPNNYYRITRSDPTTNVYLNGVLILPVTFNNNYTEFFNNTPNVIEADKPISVAQYFTTENCDGNGSPYDPDMIVLNPVEQNIDKVTLVSSNLVATPGQHHIHVIMRNGGTGRSSFTLDGAAVPPGSWIQHPNDPGYSYLYLHNVSQGFHRLVSDSGFNAIAYGYAPAETYGYSAGANVKDLYQFVSVQNQYATVNFPAACKNSPFFFSMTFPYQPTQIQWQFSGLLPDITLGNPIYDSTWFVNGKQLFRYRLPTTYSISTAGTYPIKVLAQNPTSDGCSGEQEINYDLQVFDRPQANFNFSTSGCVSDSVRFTDNVNTNGRPVVNWLWDFGDGGTASIKNPTHLYNSANTFPVKYSVITDVGCVSDTATKTVTLNSPPIAKFGISQPGCVNKSISFSDSSTTPSGSIIKWYWDFGDGSATLTATTGAAQSHSYNAPGLYKVTLKVESTSGCQSLVEAKQITIHVNPVAAFNFGNACLPLASMQFTNASTISVGTINYQWDFGDGGVSTLQNPSHAYTSAGPINTKLVVTSEAGCVDSSVKSVNTIFAQPIGLFNAPAELCLGATANYTDQSTAASSSITKWQWDFGDATTSIQQNPSHTYAAAGTYTVTLTATSAIGCISTIGSKQVIVNPLPAANFTSSIPDCIGKNITFTDASSANAGNLTKWNWDLGDGNKPTQNSSAAFIHAYLATGTYSVSLKVETDKGCASITTNKQIVVSPLPIAKFGIPDNCVADPFSQFTDSSSIVDGSQSQFTYQWNFGDANATGANPNSSSIKNPQHRYVAVGNYNVGLIVTSNAGCSDTLIRVFSINGSVPQSIFTINGGNQQCSNNVVSITNNSTVDVGRLVKLEIFWDYNNDPTNKTMIQYPTPGAVFNHNYPEFFSPVSRNYTVRVVAYSGDNCLHTTTQTITLMATPDIQFDPVPSVCADITSLQFNQAHLQNGLAGTGLYSGGNISPTGLFDPKAAGVGAYTIRYTFNASNGCTNYKEQSISVFPLPVVNAGPDRFVLEGGQALLLGTATANNPKFVWSPALYLNNPGIAQPITKPSDDITYTLTVASADGCVASDQVLVKFLKNPVIPNTFSPNGDGIHDRWEITSLDSYPGATVEIYNRYGQLVFHSVGYNTPWDGTLKGNPLPAGTYYYIINPKNGRKQMSGFVDIIR